MHSKCNRLHSVVKRFTLLRDFTNVALRSFYRNENILQPLALMQRDLILLIENNAFA